MGESGRRKVLIVDDNDEIREVLRLILSAEGFETVEAADGEAALRTMGRLASAIDAVVLDLDMPRCDGLEVLRRKADVPPLANVPVVVWSGTDRHALPEAAGVAAVFSKSAPIDRVIDEVVRTARQAQAA